MGTDDAIKLIKAAFAKTTNHPKFKQLRLAYVEPEPNQGSLEREPLEPEPNQGSLEREPNQGSLGFRLGLGLGLQCSLGLM